MLHINGKALERERTWFPIMGSIGSNIVRKTLIVGILRYAFHFEDFAFELR